MNTGTHVQARRLLAGGNSNSEVRLGLKLWATDGGDLSRADAAALQSTIVDAAPGFMLRDIAALQADTPTSVSVASGTHRVSLFHWSIW